MATLWNAESPGAWQAALDEYDAVVERQGVKPLPELDRWYREEFPAAIAKWRSPHVRHEELVRVTEWKMARGIFRPRNLVLVRGNDPLAVVQTSSLALGSKIRDRQAPIHVLSQLDGVGPATASAIMAAAKPEIYPFFDDIVAAQVPGLGAVAYTVPYYHRYAEVLRERASSLGAGWTPVMVERALWAHAGGKAGRKKR